MDWKGMKSHIPQDHVEQELEESPPVFPKILQLTSHPHGVDLVQKLSSFQTAVPSSAHQQSLWNQKMHYLTLLTLCVDITLQSSSATNKIEKSWQWAKESHWRGTTEESTPLFSLLLTQSSLLSPFQTSQFPNPKVLRVQKIQGLKTEYVQDFLFNYCRMCAKH